MKLVVETQNTGEGLIKVKTEIEEYTPEEAIPLMRSTLKALKFLIEGLPLEEAEDEQH